MILQTAENSCASSYKADFYLFYTENRVPHISTTLQYSTYFSWGLTRGKRLMKRQFSTTPHQYWPYQDIMRDRRLCCPFPANTKSLRVIKIQWITSGAKSIYWGYQSLMVYRVAFPHEQLFRDGHWKSTLSGANSVFFLHLLVLQLFP